MMSLPSNLAVVINRINDNIISDHKNANNPLLSNFLANGRAFYDNLFMPAMIDEVKAEKRRNSTQAGMAKKLQESIDVSTVRLDKKSWVPLFTNCCRMTQPTC
jgi:hypothetical protein